MCFELGTDSLTSIHPNDEDPMSNWKKMEWQYLHVGGNEGGQKLRVGFVFKVVNQTAMYQLVDDTMFVDNKN